MKILALLSGGIDSPVAAHMMSGLSEELLILHIDNRPYSDEEEEGKFSSLARRLGEICGYGIKTFRVPFSEIQSAIKENCCRRLQCVLCKRMMLRIAERVARREGALALVTGESLGQVASQTIRNIKVEGMAANMPILRPLIGMNKVEIIEIAKEIGTYDISVGPGVSCGIVPDRPSTMADLGRVLEEEGKMDVRWLVEGALKGMVIIFIDRRG